jgi:hypothetical protein
MLTCTPEDVAILVTAGKVRPLGRPNPNAVKFFSAVEVSLSELEHLLKFELHKIYGRVV